MENSGQHTKEKEKKKRGDYMGSYSHEKISEEMLR